MYQYLAAYNILNTSFPNNFVMNKKENIMHANIRWIYFEGLFPCDLITFFTI